MSSPQSPGEGPFLVWDRHGSYVGIFAWKEVECWTHLPQCTFVPEHMAKAAPEMAEALRKAEQLAGICTDWNLPEAEIDGEMVSVYDLQAEFRAALAAAESEGGGA